MYFAQIIDDLTNSSVGAQNMLTDGEFTFTYSEVPALLAKVEEFLAPLGIDSTTCVAVECNNSVPSALLLLALLRSGKSFVLSPYDGDRNDLRPTPHFCRERLIVGVSEASRRATSFPQDCVRVERNPNYNGRAVTPETVYLRTSGSMGESKIVVHAHEKLIGNARNCVRKYGFTERSRAVIPVPIAHMYGFGAEFLPAILAGASIDLQDRTNLLRYLERERQFQPTITFATPAICEMLLKGFKAPRSNYQAFVTSGQQMKEETFRAFDALVGGRLINQYGSTELGATAACDPGDALDRRATSIGKPMNGVNLRLERQRDSGTASDISELYCKHPYGFLGYLDENGDWLREQTPDAWFRTGDLAFAEPDGSLRVVGRADASVNRSGYLILLSDVERLMEKLEVVKDVAVVAIRGESKHGQRIAAFCVPHSGADVTGARIRELCFDFLPHYAIPDQIHLLEAMPMLPAGKLDRQFLAALIQ